MFVRLLICLIFLILTGCSVTKEPVAYSGIAADTITTAIATTKPGLSEANPLGWWVLPLSIGLVEYGETLQSPKGDALILAVGSAKWGAATNNLLLILGATSMPSIAAGVTVFALLWHHGIQQIQRSADADKIENVGTEEDQYNAWCKKWIAERPGNYCKPYKAP
jgi:hypothetical protein